MSSTARELVKCLRNPLIIYIYIYVYISFLFCVVSCDMAMQLTYPSSRDLHQISWNKFCKPELGKPWATLAHSTMYVFTYIYCGYLQRNVGRQADANYHCKFCLINFVLKRVSEPRPVAGRSEARVCGYSLLGLRVRIPPMAWMSVCCKCRVLSGRGLCDWPIPHPEEPYR